MPQVPYQPYTTAQPQGGGEALRVQTPGAAFGENIGAALTNLGTTTERVGGELFQRASALQTLQNEADARQAQMDNAEKTTLLHMDFNSKQGKARYDALPGFIQSLKDLHTNIRGTLTNPEAQRFFDQESMPFLQRNIFAAGSMAGDALKQHVVQTAKDSAAVTAKSFVDPFSISEYNEKLGAVRQSADTLEGALNWDPVSKQRYILEETSKLRAAQLTQVGQTDPTQALALLDQYQKDLTQVDYDHTMDRLRAQNRAVGGVNLASSVYGADKPFSQMEQEIKDKAPALAHGDPLFEKDALSSLRTKVVYDKGVQKADNIDTENKIVKTILEANVLNIQQLRAQPGMAEAIDSLPPLTQKGIPDWINNWQTKKNKLGERAEFDRVMGMFKGDNEAAREEALNINPTTLNISPDQMVQVLAERARVLKQPTNDPRLVHALSVMKHEHGSELEALKVYNRGDNKTDYDHYVGALSSAVDTWTQEKGKPPSPAEIRDTIGPMVIRQRAGDHWWSSNRPFFDQDTPEDFAEKVRTDAERRGEAAPTDEELNRAYVRGLLLDLYSKDSSSGGPATPKSK